MTPRAAYAEAKNIVDMIRADAATAAIKVHKLITVNPARGVARFTRPADDDRVDPFTPEELRLILSAAVVGSGIIKSSRKSGNMAARNAAVPYRPMKAPTTIR